MSPKTLLMSIHTKKHKKVVYHLSYPIGNIYLSKTRTSVLKMIDVSLNNNLLLVDLGCGSGSLTKALSEISETIGLDIDKGAIRWAKRNMRWIDFILADIRHLPFKNASIDVAICTSVLEYIENLDEALKEIKTILKKGGMLIVGYPINTKLLKTIMRILCRIAERTSDPLKIIEFYNKYEKDSSAHKHDYLAIRVHLINNFIMLKRKKIPFDMLSDFLSIYECVKLVNK